MAVVLLKSRFILYYKSTHQYLFNYFVVIFCIIWYLFKDSFIRKKGPLHFAFGIIPFLTLFVAHLSLVVGNVVERRSITLEQCILADQIVMTTSLPM